MKYVVRGLVLAAFAVLALSRSRPPESAAPEKAARLDSPRAEKAARLDSPAAAPERWAGDELLVRGDAASRSLPEGRLVEDRGHEALFRLPAPLDRARFLALAKDVESRPGVKEVRPIFYASAARRPSDYLELTRQVGVTLREGMSIEVLAARAGARVGQKLEFMERTWLLEASTPFGALEIAEALKDEGLPLLEPQFARRASSTFTPNDPHFGAQWHLQNSINAGQDLNVVTAWDGVQGAGVVIGIVDNGLQHAHPDLQPAYDASLSFDFNEGNADPSPLVGASHGTICAGLAAARGNNGLGVSGAAPQSTLAGLRLTAGSISDALIANAMSYRSDAIHVKSNSWTLFAPPHTLLPSGPFTKNAITNAAISGRGGRGTVFVWAAGNDGDVDGNSNFDQFANHRHVIAVPALLINGRQTGYSEWGANLLVSAPGGNGDIVSTDLVGQGDFNGDYTDSFSGTSASTPLVAGVAGLLLSRRPELKARDVMHLLVRGARKNDSSDAEWATNGVSLNVNYKYGFGAVDAAASLALADQWPLVGAETFVAGSSGVNVPIPDAPAAAVSSSIGLAGPALRVEAVEVDLNITHEWRGDLRITLISPSNTRSVLVRERFVEDDDNYVFTFTSRRHWGESSAGTWTLEIQDMDPIVTGTLNSWGLRIYGSALDTTPPAAGVVNEGSGEDVDGQSSLTTVEANWSGFSDPQSGLAYEIALGTTPGAEDVRPFTPAGTGTSGSFTGLSLAEGTRYYVSVRAKNFEGLTTVVSGDGVVPDTLAPDPPAPPLVTPARSSTGQFTLSWAAPADPGGSGIVLYDVQRSKNGGAFVDHQTGVAVTTFVADVAAFGEGDYAFSVRAIDAAGNGGAFSGASTTVRFDPQPPAVTIDAPGAPVSSPLAISGTSSDTFGVVAVSWVNLSTGAGGTASGTASWSASVPLGPGSNVIHVFAWDATGNAGTSTLNVNYAPSDLLPPLLTVSAPGSTASPTLALSGAATDNVGVASIEWENRRTGTRGSAVGTAPFNASVPLLLGANVIRTTARDAAGNAASVEIALSYAPAAVDAAPPTVAITSPNGGAAHGTSTSPLAPSGTASDDTALAAILWSNAATGGAGTASGLANWTSSAALAPGVNEITVTALDASGNTSTDTQTVTFTPAGSDEIAPRVSILGPSGGASFVTGSGRADLSGLATDDVGALEVIWSNAATGESGTASGVGAWSAAIPLAGGANAITLTAYDANGNAGTDTITVTLASGGGGGGGGCGLTGLEVLLLLPLARRRRR